MKRIRLLGLALIAVFALGALASASAFAENPEILPNPTSTSPLTFTSETTPGTTPTLESTNGLKIVCEKATNKGEFTSARSGKVKINFTGCKEKTANCQSGTTAGEIALEGPIELVDVLPTATLDLGLWLEPTAVGGGVLKFKCGVLADEVKSSLLAVVDNAKGELLTSGTKTKEVIVLWKGEKGEQAITACDLTKARCEGKTFKLESNLGKGFELAAEIADAKIVTASEVTYDF